MKVKESFRRHIIVFFINNSIARISGLRGFLKCSNSNY